MKEVSESSTTEGCLPRGSFEAVKEAAEVVKVLIVGSTIETIGSTDSVELAGLAKEMFIPPNICRVVDVGPVSEVSDKLLSFNRSKNLKS